MTRLESQPDVREKIPWWQPDIGAKERMLVDSVFDSNFFNDGEYTVRFEKELAERLGCRHVVTFTSGTMSIFGALYSLGIGPGDEVIVPDVTFIATANAVTLTGAKAVLVDVERERLTIDPKAIRAAITPRTKAIIPVHLSGRGADMEVILQIAQEHDLLVVEDAAEAFMSQVDGKCLGTLGDAGCFSFSPMKTIMTGQGGAVATNDDDLFVRLWELKDQGRPIRGTGGNDIHVSVGFNFKFTNIQAAIGLGQLEQLDERLERLQRHYAIYAEELDGVGGIELIGFDREHGESPQWIDALVEDRKELVKYLNEHQIDSRCFWHPLHTQKPYQQADEAFAVSSEMAVKALWLPSAFTLTDEDIRYVCEHVRKYYAWKSWIYGSAKKPQRQAASQ